MDDQLPACHAGGRLKVTGASKPGYINVVHERLIAGGIEIGNVEYRNPDRNDRRGENRRQRGIAFGDNGRMWV